MASCIIKIRKFMSPPPMKTAACRAPARYIRHTDKSLQGPVSRVRAHYVVPAILAGERTSGLS